MNFRQPKGRSGLLTKDEVVDLCRQSYSTIRRKEMSGDFPARIRLGPAAVFWREEEILAWLENRPRGPAASPREKAQAAKKQREIASAPACMFELLEVLVVQNQLLLVELRKIVEGNAALYGQLRAVRLLQEKKRILEPDDK